MTPLVFDSEAEAELRGAIKRYEEERAGLGDEFWSEVQQVLRLIGERPRPGGNISRVRTQGSACRLLVRRFPYFVIYRERPDHLQVLPSLTRAAGQGTGAAE